MSVIAEPRLDADSAIKWYLLASPDQIDMMEIAYLDGQSVPYTESREGFDVDGVEFKIRHDFGTRPIDWRGFQFSTGS